jgi:tRNA threonylcarbamoyladenosine biosynthesis protein TsaE
MESFGEALGACLEPHDVLLLIGRVGVGKTTLAKGIARALGVEGPVTSPTFTIVRQYKAIAPIDEFVHVDLYRMETLGEVRDLDIDSLVEQGAIAVIEWGEDASVALPHVTMRIELGIAEDTGDPLVVTQPRRAALFSERDLDLSAFSC